MMDSTYTFLFAPFNARGHVFACVGIGQELLSRGHKVVFATSNDWKGKLKEFGFQEEYYEQLSDDDTCERLGEVVSSMAPALALPALEQMEHLVCALYQECVKQTKAANPMYQKIMENVKPNVVVVDSGFQVPALMNTGIPWVMSTSLVPSGIVTSENIPSSFSGYSVLDKDKILWKTFAERAKERFSDLFTDFKGWVVENGGPELEWQGLPYLHELSSYANIYMYPLELDYTSIRPNPGNWHQFDAFVRTEEESFEVPSKLENLPGKLIYVSMGTIGCCELGLMRKLIGMLAKSPHRFIVSKGPLGDQLTLPDNMWGEKNLTQTKVIQTVDLVITHGGNNTVTESFYFGKRLLVLPLFCDQLDNAQRIHDTGLGMRLDPYKMTELELLAALEKLLGDDLLGRRMFTIGQRMRASNSQSRAADVVEKVAIANDSSKKML